MDVTVDDNDDDDEDEDHDDVDVTVDDNSENVLEKFPQDKNSPELLTYGENKLKIANMQKKVYRQKLLHDNHDHHDHDHEQDDHV